MSFVIGLTGPTGAGKSSVTTVAEELGFKVVDCDKLARKAVERGSAGHGALMLAFGTEILNREGEINRKKLAEIAFSTPKNTELLNKTVLPYIMMLVREEIDCDKVLLDAPTLFESGADNLCDEVIAVISDEKTRLDRIMARDNIDEEAALLRIKAGKPDEFYIEKTDNIVYNDCELSVFNLKIQKLITKLLEEHNNV
ncbi:MAG: dephospho-CoA kinase [Ruminococcaceae bacterium]|nr:dephospho-CoA kinase [Oscillospiraceae bacterium]